MTDNVLPDNMHVMYNKAVSRLCYIDNNSVPTPYPISDLVDLRGKDFVIVDCLNQYKLTEEARVNYENLDKIFDKTYIYESKVIRIDNIVKAKNVVSFFTSRTSYFKFLATNSLWILK